MSSSAKKMWLFTYMLVLTSVISDITARACLKLDLSTPVIRNVSHFTCDDNPYVNGCNVPFRAYRMALQSECNKHDICYSCGSRYGVSRRSCDFIFGQNIHERCDSVDREAWCRLLTFLSYAGVRISGRRQYSIDSPEWCADSWVETCLYIRH